MDVESKFVGTCYESVLGRGDKVHGGGDVEDSLEVGGSDGGEVDVHCVEAHAGQSVEDDHASAHYAPHTSQESCNITVQCNTFF